MPVKRLGKPSFLRVDEVKDGDVLVAVEPPDLVEAEKSKWGKERYRIVVTKHNDREFGLRRWTMNTSTSNKLLEAFGEDEKLWVGKKIRIRKREEFIQGKQKSVLYGEPYIEPQKTLETS